MKTKFKIISTNLVFKNKFIRIRHDVIKFITRSKIHNYFTIEGNDIASILALNEQGKAILLQEYRFSVNKSILSLPGGAVKRGELPKITAIRELLEETGYQTGKVTRLVSFYLDPGKSNQKMTVFFAKKAIKVSNPKDARERISLTLLNIAKLKRMVELGKIDEPSLLVASLILLNCFLKVRHQRFR